MPNYRRAKFCGGYYFFTVVTYRKRKLFIDQQARDILKDSINQVKIKYPFETIAFCLMPDHLHTIWKLPEYDNDFSIRWSYIKGKFSRDYRKIYNSYHKSNWSRDRKGETTIWQRRFWEHQIRNETDLQKHVDYIHFNPIKHSLVKDLSQWPWSTYHKYAKDGFYNKYDFEIIKQLDDTTNFGE